MEHRWIRFGRLDTRLFLQHLAKGACGSPGALRGRSVDQRNFYSDTGRWAVTGRLSLPVTLGLVLWVLGFVGEVLRLLEIVHRFTSMQDWFADAAGVAAALVPIALGRFRDSFRPTRTR